MTLRRTIVIEPSLRLGLTVEDGALVAIDLRPTAPDQDTHPVLDETERQLRHYFSGTLHTFDLPWRTSGTLFQESVWRMVYAIPYGRTRTYMDLARELNSPGAVRAVGTANGTNPLPILIPCHRVVATGGGMGGYGGGVDLKRRLLALEGAILL
ncbi:MAG TPA: methylated-DNA--[protein]-cysteine S-methyltransferase [Bryobacteraceae bacterium]|nr:methylated-DNA--[protein]-cysteine S-methyltransferase [Bryobacteraceae bacterium]